MGYEMKNVFCEMKCCTDWNGTHFAQFVFVCTRMLWWIRHVSSPVVSRCPPSGHQEFLKADPRALHISRWHSERKSHIQLRATSAVHTSCLVVADAAIRDSVQLATAHIILRFLLAPCCTTTPCSVLGADQCWPSSRQLENFCALVQINAGSRCCTTRSVLVNASLCVFADSYASIP